MDYETQGGVRGPGDPLPSLSAHTAAEVAGKASHRLFLDKSKCSRHVPPAMVSLPDDRTFGAHPHVITVTRYRT